MARWNLTSWGSLKKQDVTLENGRRRINIRPGATFTQVNFSPVWMLYDLLPPGGQMRGWKSVLAIFFCSRLGIHSAGSKASVITHRSVHISEAFWRKCLAETKEEINGPCSETDQTATASPQTSRSWRWPSLTVHFEPLALNYGGKIFTQKFRLVRKKRSRCWVTHCRHSHV